MKRPIALKLVTAEVPKIYRVKTEPIDIASLNAVSNSNAIVVARNAIILEDLTTAIIDADDIIAAKNGNWNDTILLILDDENVVYEPSGENQLPINAANDQVF